MVLGIMQPYFLPYIGYLQLIQAVDHFILLDEVQYIRHGWIERNRILKPSKDDWQYIKVPLQKHERETLIKDVKIDNAKDWRKTILAQLMHYKKGNPRYASSVGLVEQALNIDTDSITQLNAHSLKVMASHLGINTPISIFSEMGMEIEEVKGAGDWALNISKALGADVYINPINGKELFDSEAFTKAGINLCFIKPKEVRYAQPNEDFIPYLSIVDILMSAQEVEGFVPEFTLSDSH
jgi:hypothetical protein